MHVDVCTGARHCRYSAEQGIANLLILHAWSGSEELHPAPLTYPDLQAAADTADI